MKTKLLLLGLLPALFIGNLTLSSCSDDTKDDLVSGMTTPKLGEVTIVESTLTHNAVTLNAELLDWGGAEANSSGICWSTTVNPSVELPTKAKVAMTDPGKYEIPITGLIPETKYYARSFARNSRGLVYSEQFEFETKAESPDMMDYAEVSDPQLVGEPGKILANVKSTVVSNGGGTLKRAGFVVSEKSSPTLEDKVYEMAMPKLGSLEITLNSLLANTTYYVRSFAENAKGVVYSANEISFTTQQANMSLKGNCGKTLLIGGTAEVPLYTPDCLSEKAEKIIETEYNVLQIPCYPSAWGGSWAEDGTMNLDTQKAYVDWCKDRNIKTIGHCMIGTSDTDYPDWFKNKPYSKAELEAELENRIKTVIEKMGGDRVDMWNVVNEIIVKGIYVPCKWTDLGYEDIEVAGSKANPKPKIPIYIRKAFEYAKKYAPAAELILSAGHTTYAKSNVYNTFIMSASTDLTSIAFRQLAEHLQANGLVTTIGLQLNQVQAQGGFDKPEGMAGWAQIPGHVKFFKDKGFKVLINEVSISKNKKAADPVFTTEDLGKQKNAYNIFVGAAVDAGVDGILFSGLGDGWDTEFRPYDEAHLYDSKRDRKPAFEGVRDALMERFPSED